MNSDELIAHAERLIKLIEIAAIERRKRGDDDFTAFYSFKTAFVQAEELLRVHCPKGSAFYQHLSQVSFQYTESAINSTLSIMRGFVAHVAAGLHGALSPQRQAQIDVVSDLQEQALALLDNDKVHPAAPAVLLGAVLEEFLRTWVEAENLHIGNAKPGIDVYAKLLRERELISKQDIKDITSWGGIRNAAAHGHWSEVEDRARIDSHSCRLPACTVVCS